jgi:PAT family beta-lactamase induction signal transducer AmpG
MATALIAHLTEKGITDTQAADLTAIILIPWTFKLVWAPLIDTMTIRSMGRRRPWIIGAELMMALSLLGILALGDLQNNLGMLGWMFFVHNCFASLQDVSTDALAVDMLPPNEQGRVNGLMWGSKLIGKAVGAAGMAWLLSVSGLQLAILAQMICLLVIMLFPILILERPGEKRLPWSTGQAMGVESDSGLRPLNDVVHDLYRAFRMRTTSLFFVFGTLAVVGWGILEIVTKQLYTAPENSLGWKALEYSTATGWAVFPEMLGALAGGIMADRFGRRLTMTIGFGSYGCFIILFAALPQLWTQHWFANWFLILNPGFLAIGAVGFLSMGMRLSWTKAAASMFTIYMTVSNVGHVLGNKLMPVLSHHMKLSQQHVLLSAGLLTLAPLAILIWIRPADVDAQVAADNVDDFEQVFDN